jgi:hypothetical protein
MRFCPVRPLARRIGGHLLHDGASGGSAKLYPPWPHQVLVRDEIARRQPMEASLWRTPGGKSWTRCRGWEPAHRQGRHRSWSLGSSTS